jgi:transcriptional regulatory protein LevR
MRPLPNRKNYRAYNETPSKGTNVKKIEILKKAVTTIVGIGTAKIIREVIKNNVDTETVTSMVTVTAASAAIGGAVSELTKQYTDTTIDEMVEFIQKIKNRKNSQNEED